MAKQALAHSSGKEVRELATKAWIEIEIATALMPRNDGKKQALPNALSMAAVIFRGASRRQG